MTHDHCHFVFLRWVLNGVTRFGEILPLMQNFNIFGYSLRAYFVFGKMLTIIGQMFIKLN